MNIHELIPYLFVAVFVAFVAWSVIRGRRWEKYQGEAARRAKAMMERVSSDEGRLDEVMAVSREHLQVTKDLLSEIKALRSDLSKNERKNA